MNKAITGLLAALAFAGCAGRKQIVLPMKQPPRVEIPGAIRTLMFETVTERRGDVPAGYRADGDSSVPLVKAMMSSEFCTSTYAVLNDELLAMVKKSGSVPKYLADGPTVATDFLDQMVGDPGSIGVVEIDVVAGFGDRFSVERQEVTLTTTTWDANGRPNTRVDRRPIAVHRIDVFGSLTATIRIRSPYPEGKAVFEKTYTVPDFKFSSSESVPTSLWLFGRNDAAKSGKGAPTLTEVKAIQIKQLARMFFEDINPSVKEEKADLDSRGDKMAYNLLSEGAFPFAEMRLRSLANKGKPEEIAANTYNLGMCWEAQGMAGEAAVKYKSAMQLEPGNSLFKRAYERADNASK